ncbi:MAG: NADH:flavin oxidoreductase [Firmicutes bacterium]|nr:NADH:flavin oxidoreductase [Bacillota bacterium]
MNSLFDQTKLAGLNLKNRFIRSATYDGVADPGGRVNDAILRIYEQLAQGGVGTIITGLTAITDREQIYPGQMALYDDACIAGYNQLTDTVHRYDTKIIMQLACMGSQSIQAPDEGKIMWGPSAIEDIGYKTTPQEMTKEEINYLQTAFAEAAARAKQAGFDGVQMHGAHGYLLSKFLNSYYNRRTDEYGGNIENRARMVLETYQAIRDKVGPDFPILIKINCDDFMTEGGLTLDECKYVSKKLDDLGLDAIEVSGGSRSSKMNKGPSRLSKRGPQSYFATQAAELAKELTLSVILVGGNRDLAALTELINKTPIEYIALSRPLIAEPDLINKWQQQLTHPAKCISCNKCYTPGGTKCILNQPKKH